MCIIYMSYCISAVPVYMESTQAKSPCTPTISPTLSVNPLPYNTVRGSMMSHFLDPRIGIKYLAPTHSMHIIISNNSNRIL